jgi:predicted nuclease of restriction endonuclease-like (RecB) superfamily
LSWSHFSALLPLSQPFQREFYAEMARIEGWSVRTLRARIDSMLYERTALSKQSDALIRQELAILRSRRPYPCSACASETSILHLAHLESG